jgi:hypothetical protein
MWRHYINNGRYVFSRDFGEIKICAINVEMSELDKINGTLPTNDEGEIPSAFYPHIKSLLDSLDVTLARPSPGTPAALFRPGTY